MNDLIQNIAISFIMILILIGALLSLVSTIGLLRLPDVYTRTHAASKASTLGVMMMMFGAFLYFWIVKGHFNAELFLAVLFIFITAPVGAHLITRSAYYYGVEPSKSTSHDDLKKTNVDQS